MIEAVYISDSTNSLVYEYTTSLCIPKFKSLVPKVTSFNDSTTIDNKSTTSNKIPLNSKLYLFVHQHQQSALQFFLLCKEIDNANPLLPSIFIRRLIEVMEDYFGDLNSVKIEANNEILTLLLYQMLDDGTPYITDFNKLRDLVSYKSLLSKLLSSATTVASKATGTAVSNKGPLDLNRANNHQTTDIPWRRNNVKHTNNEMYVDVIETVNVIIKPTTSKTQRHLQLETQNQGFDSAFYSSASNKSFSGGIENHLISGYIDGEINFLSRLTGVPALQLSLNSVGTSKIQLPSLHRCIDLDVWNENRGILSFIPPDGKSTLMRYQIDFNKTNQNRMSDKRSTLSLLKSASIEAEFICHENTPDFEIRLNLSQSISKIDFLSVEIVSEHPDDQIKMNRATHGDFSTKGNGKAEWILRQLKPNVFSPVFYGSVISNTENSSDEEEEEGPRYEDSQEQHNKRMAKSKPSYLKLSYSHKGPVPSGLKVDSLKIISAKGLGDTVKPYKGVKYMTKSGNYIVRS